MWGRCQHGFLTRTAKLALLRLTSNKEYNCCVLLQQLQEFIMWEALITSIFSILKSHFDEVIVRITTWFLSFILCWLLIPAHIQIELMARPLPALPDYALVYLFYLVAATSFWQMFFIILDILASLVEKFRQYKAVNPQSKWVEIDGEYKNYTFFKCHRLSLLLRIKKSSSSAKN